MSQWMKFLRLVIPILVAVGPDRPVHAAENDSTKRTVLVELYTSQGCDMCPAAEKLLGALAERDRGILPIAFHVKLDGKSPATKRFPLAIEPTWSRQKVRLAVFVQDKRTAVVHQAADLPWRSTKIAATSATSTAKGAPDRL
jgi:hypothetical protein